MVPAGQSGSDEVTRRPSYPPGFLAARFSWRFSFNDFCAGFLASFFCLSEPFIR